MYIFIAYLTMLSATQTNASIGRIFNGSERIWGKWLWPDLKVLSKNLSGGIEEHQENSQVDRCSGSRFEPITSQIQLRNITA
jgi:hypothetical protein